MNKLKKEYLFFKQQEPNMRTLLVTNMLYALVLPIVEIFVGAYIMRKTHFTKYRMYRKSSVLRKNLNVIRQRDS